MKIISVPPGAINYRLTMMVILILILISVFFYKLESSQKEIEKASIEQTTTVITSSLAIVFASHAVNGKIQELYLLAGHNPFEFLDQYQIKPAAYKGETESTFIDSLDAGWYYLIDKRQTVYISHYLSKNYYYKINLEFDDVNRSGQFELGLDIQRGLSLKSLI